MDKAVLSDVYRFWFGDIGDAAILPGERVRYWMMGGDETDSAIRSRYGAYIAQAAESTWFLSALSREQSVALVVLFDQFPRNCYRTSGEAFAYDHLARGVVQELEATSWSFTAAERFFLGLPYVHHEDMVSQNRAVLLAALELDRCPPEGRTGLGGNLDQAIRHRAVIQRFGRFPHRNAMLGRASTPEEVEFMATALNGRGF
jgi:uncharacterized protein (DUF924 family)